MCTQQFYMTLLIIKMSRRNLVQYVAKDFYMHKTVKKKKWL